MLYYRYHYLWSEFFNILGHETVVSPVSNREILEKGQAYSMDESCLPSKLFMGHVHALNGLCDMVLMPRVVSLSKNEKICVKFSALYDSVRTVFKDVRLLDYSVDIEKNQSEKAAFLAIGKALGHNKTKSARAYAAASAYCARMLDAEDAAEKKKFLLSSLKILLVGHTYNLHDAMIGVPVAALLKRLGAAVIYSDKLKALDVCAKNTYNYWTFNKELLAAAEYYKSKADGIIFLTAFPCGPDSLVHELALRNFKNMPVCHLVIDELKSESGIETRLECFMDIVKAKASLNAGNDCLNGLVI